MTEKITTAEELDALPVGSVVLDRDNTAWQKVEGGAWVAPDDLDEGWPSEDLSEERPRFLYRPDAPAPSAEDREALGGVRAASSLMSSLAETLDGYEDAGDIDSAAVRDAVQHVARTLRDAVELLHDRDVEPAPIECEGPHEYIVQADDWRECRQCGKRYQRWDPARQPAPVDADTITVPRPHVAHGPAGVHPDEADAEYLRSAVRNIEHQGRGERLWGSNLTATVVRLLIDAAFAIEHGPAPQPAPTVSAETMGALDELCRLDDEFGMEPSDVRWVRERAQAIRAALAVTP